MFVDADLAREKSTRRIYIGILIFINKDHMRVYIKRKATVDASTFGAEFFAMR